MDAPNTFKRPWWVPFLVDILAELVGAEQLEQFQLALKEKNDAIRGKQADIRNTGISTADALREL